MGFNHRVPNNFATLVFAASVIDCNSRHVNLEVNKISLMLKNVGLPRFLHLKLCVLCVFYHMPDWSYELINCS